jgi:DNA-binding NarL/FixJ family response regulator
MGYITKSSSNEVLASALRLVLSGGIYIPPPVLGRADTPPQRRLAYLGLSHRQAEILSLLMRGKSNKLICRELDLAESTVKNHVTLVLKALNVTSRTQAVLAAARLGLALEPLDARAQADPKEGR